MQYSEKISLYIDGKLMGTGQITNGRIHRYEAQVQDAQLVTDYVLDLIEKSISFNQKQLRLGHSGATRTITWRIFENQ